MLFFGDWLTFAGFWFYLFRIFRLDGKKVPLVFACLWAVGYFGLPTIGIEGAIYFISYKAVLTLALMFIDLYRMNMGKRNPPDNPLKDVLDS
ncbi:MAG: hypothetical protein COA96_02290 [SAR86 cluster bacterium]|uniref:Uncharacterized protein n=1 Tax=SAR86 cluster bacterium TaxID=2030880 RepID=A0A2A5B953_9GAMM|nr:MAG: hypothetical protein COA96_02290 [SAR86 cluster bacterium]